MNGIQSALEPAGVHADRIGTLWNVFLGVSAVVYVLVLLFLAVALLRRRGAVGRLAVGRLGGGEEQAAAPHEHTDSETSGAPLPPPNRPTANRPTLIAVSVATGITVVILFALLVSSIFTGRAIAYAPAAPIQVTVTGRQWWWQVDYDTKDVSKRITTANELYIPVGVPVQVHLRSTDVIHSFWVPNLHGKQDLIPGHQNAILLQATRPGVYRGQCAEFCGLQHAKMALWVTALAPADFAKWAAAQQESSKIPSTPRQRQGQEVFTSVSCALCHNVQGTEASGKVGPDLTHFASRRSIAAGALPNRRAELASWILDPQHVKPGAYMPPTRLGTQDLEPLLDYLESLQ
jgi:cytochrome c oxidase subunit 2